MHPIEAKSLGLINDDEFNSLMHADVKYAKKGVVATKDTKIRPLTAPARTENQVYKYAGETQGKGQLYFQTVARQWLRLHPRVKVVQIMYDEGNKTYIWVFEYDERWGAKFKYKNEMKSSGYLKDPTKR